MSEHDSRYILHPQKLTHFVATSCSLSVDPAATLLLYFQLHRQEIHSLMCAGGLIMQRHTIVTENG